MVCVTCLFAGMVVLDGGFISIVMYLGTAHCIFNPYIGVAVVLIICATTVDFCLFQTSGLVHWNSTLTPACRNPGTMMGAAVVGSAVTGGAVVEEDGSEALVLILVVAKTSDMDPAGVELGVGVAAKTLLMEAVLLMLVLLVLVGAEKTWAKRSLEGGGAVVLVVVLVVGGNMALTGTAAGVKVGAGAEKISDNRSTSLF